MPRPADRAREETGRDETAGGRSESRPALGRFLLAGFVALVVVGTPAAFLARVDAESHALRGAAPMAQRSADNAGAPIIAEEVFGGDPDAVLSVDSRLAPRPVEEGSGLTDGRRAAGAGAGQAEPGDRFEPGPAPPFLLSLAVLQLAQLVLVLGLARRTRAGQAARRPPRRAVDASGLERRRIARDLHDDVIQDLAGLSYAMESEVTRGTSAQLPFLTRALAVLQQSVRTLRAMTTELYPLDLDRLGLPLALARLADPLRAQGIDVKLSLPDHCELGREHSAVLYRVAREILANILKHAEARTVEFSLGREAGQTLLRISDDGRGFDPAAGATEGHLGLRIMRDTMFEAGGGFDIRSRPGAGTVVSASLRGGGHGAG